MDLPTLLRPRKTTSGAGGREVIGEYDGGEEEGGTVDEEDEDEEGEGRVGRGTSRNFEAVQRC